MLTNTFKHIDGVGVKHERTLQESGFRSWWDVVDKSGDLPFGDAMNRQIREETVRSIRRFVMDDISYFAEKLPAREHWRILNHYRREIGYLDIETDDEQSITVIGMFIGGKYYCYKKGDDTLMLERMFAMPSAIVSFNGISFDVPQIKREFPFLKMPDIHFDLLRSTHSVGWSGGLKKLEVKLGIERPPSVRNLSGYDAVLLWRKYIYYRDRKAFNTLVEYNKYDVLNLEKLFIKFIEKKMEMPESA